MSALALRFLADESCDFAIVRVLRAKGYDVLAVSKVMHRSDDRELIDADEGQSPKPGGPLGQARCPSQKGAGHFSSDRLLVKAIADF